MSDSGSRMGAAGRCQARSEAVTVPGSTSLTCRNIVLQQFRRLVRSVRIEGVRVTSAAASRQPPPLVPPTCPGTLSAGRIPLVTMRNCPETLTRSRTVTNRRAMAAPAVMGGCAVTVG